jgi:hypothetical protein
MRCQGVVCLGRGPRDTTIKQQEDLNAQAATLAQREQAVADWELKLQEREVQDDLRLECKLEALASHESNLSSREATLAVEWKDLKGTRVGVLARELAADIRDVCLNSREEELGDREKRLVER